MGILAFLLKPLLYVVAFWIALAAFKSSAPHASIGAKPLPGWALVALASLGRLVLGIPIGLLAVTVAGQGSRLLMFAIIVPVGALLWFGVAKLAFPRVPRSALLVFTVAAELVSGGIDFWAWEDVSSISFC